MASRLAAHCSGRKIATDIWSCSCRRILCAHGRAPPKPLTDPASRFPERGSQLRHPYPVALDPHQAGQFPHPHGCPLEGAHGCHVHTYTGGRRLITLMRLPTLTAIRVQPPSTASGWERSGPNSNSVSSHADSRPFRCFSGSRRHRGSVPRTRSEAGLSSQRLRFAVTVSGSATSPPSPTNTATPSLKGSTKVSAGKESIPSSRNGSTTSMPRSHSAAINFRADKSTSVYVAPFNHLWGVLSP